MNTLRFTAIGLIAAGLLAACQPDAAQKQPAPAASAAAAATGATETKRIAITAIVDHPSLNAIRQGVLDQLKAEGFEEGKNLQVDFQSAQGNPSTATQIAKKFAGDNPDVIVAITTPSAQAVAAATKTIPVVFAGITDPIGAKLIQNWQPSSTNITGTSNHRSMEPDLALMRELLPNLKNIGYVYSPGEANSVSMLNDLREQARKQGLNVVEAPAPTTAQVLTAARSLKTNPRFSGCFCYNLALFITATSCSTNTPPPKSNPNTIKTGKTKATSPPILPAPKPFLSSFRRPM